jgi:hypothetical protein
MSRSSGYAHFDEQTIEGGLQLFDEVAAVPRDREFLGNPLRQLQLHLCNVGCALSVPLSALGQPQLLAAR